MQTMKPSLVRLVDNCELDQFVQFIKELKLNRFQAEDLWKSALATIAPLVWRDKYGSSLQHGYYALADLPRVWPHLNSGLKHVSIFMVLWQINSEEIGSSFSGLEHGVDLASEQSLPLSTFLEQKNLEQSFGVIKQAIHKAEFEELTEALLLASYRDIASLGSKLIASRMLWQVLDRKFPETATHLFPWTHYLTHGPRDLEFANLVDLKVSQYGKDIQIFADNQLEFLPEEADRLERVILYQYPGLIIENFFYELDRGVSIDQILQLIFRASLQSYLTAYPEHWFYCVKGFLYAEAAWFGCKKIKSKEDQVKLLFMAALQVNKMAIESLDPLHKNQDPGEPLVDATVHLDSLRIAIAEANEVLAGRLAEALACKMDIEGLKSFLAHATLMKDPGVLQGLGLSIAASLLDAYDHLALPGREKTFKVLARLLARTENDTALYSRLIILSA